MAAVRQDRRGIAPGPCPARQRAAQQRCAVIDLHRAALASAVPVSVSIVIGDAVADRAAVGRERGDRRGDRGVVSMVTLSAAEAALVLPAASVAVAVRLWAPFGSAAVV